MKRNNSNKYFGIGGLLSFIYFGIGHFIILPSILKGFFLGISIVIYSVDLYSLNHDVNKLQSTSFNLLVYGPPVNLSIHNLLYHYNY